MLTHLLNPGELNDRIVVRTKKLVEENGKYHVETDKEYRLFAKVDDEKYSVRYDKSILSSKRLIRAYSHLRPQFRNRFKYEIEFDEETFYTSHVERKTNYFIMYAETLRDEIIFYRKTNNTPEPNNWELEEFYKCSCNLHDINTRSKEDTLTDDYGRGIVKFKIRNYFDEKDIIDIGTLVRIPKYPDTLYRTTVVTRDSNFYEIEAREYEFDD